ncbi:pyridoxamine 5'-phosphate oxidase family protein [uncultured Roseobacter sp.]|uniref:pyridoxamine 5'-phosphate oxidase family protein n=1 Tax=uncultured Roseobacter sp. TaxID=114847 RepID=UPI002623D14A|nr:pyridoxamine 5'-phosphate oxidase family protein [uncultured Roseobacter sp.]
MQRYDDIMFTSAVKALQQVDGTAETYARSYGARTHALNEDEVAFITSRTSFYMATVSETGWPYIQHRGGPAGFLKVLDDHTLGFADYRGNRQHISEGNLAGDDRVSLFLMDYPRKARMKLQGRARFEPAAGNPELAAQLAAEGQGRVERLVTISLDAFDWNCPQFITPRFDTAELTALVAPEIERLETENTRLVNELAVLRAQLERRET